MPKLTKRVVDALQPSPVGEVYAWCSELRGFGVRMLPSGVAAYLIKYRNHERRTRKMVLGRVGILTPEEARGIAREHLAAVARGEDPAEKRQDARRATTVGELCERYWIAAQDGLVLGKRGAAKKASTLLTDRSRIDRHIIPLLGLRRVADLTCVDVAKFMRDVAAGKTALVEKTKKLRGKAVVEGGRGAATRTVGLLGGILTFAVSEGILAANPVHGVRRPADRKKKVRLTPAGYRELGMALEAMREESGSEAAVNAIWLLALTGCRKGEILSLRWDEVDDGGHALRLEDTKEGASVRPIGSPVFNLLARIERRHGRAYILHGRDESQPYGGLPGAFTRLSRKLSTPSLSLHALRHSYASVAGDLGYSEPTIAALLGHASGSVTGRYTHILDAVLIAAADRVANTIYGYMTGDAGAE
jgi:integrase